MPFKIFFKPSIQFTEIAKNYELVAGNKAYWQNTFATKNN
jgi:hypothetical protein